MIRFKCKACGQKMGIKPEHAGRRVKCPKCSESCVVPHPEPAESYELADVESLGHAVDEPALAKAPGLDALAALDAPAAGTAPSLATVSTAAGAAAPSATIDASGRACPKCGKPVKAQAVLCIHCGTHMKSGVSAKTVMRSRKAGKAGVAVLASAGGALLGGAIWAAIGIGTGYEIGWIAWLVGVFAGLGVTMTTDKRGPGLGLAAAALALMGIFMGKFAWAYHEVGVAWDVNPAVTDIVMQHKARTGGFPAKIQTAINAAGGFVDDIDDDLYDDAWNIAVEEAKTLTPDQTREMAVANTTSDRDYMIQLVADDMFNQRMFPTNLQNEIDAMGAVPVLGETVLGLSEASGRQAVQLVRNRYEAMDDAARRTLAEADLDLDLSMQVGDVMTSTPAKIGMAAVVAVISFIGCFQIIFLVLAVATAFKMGYGGG